MRKTRILAGTLAASALALVTAAAPASADYSTAEDRDAAGVTTVVLNPDLVPVLVNTLKVAPVAPGTLSAPGGVAQVAFPIRGEVRDNVVRHSGGLRFTPIGGGNLKITRFDVNLNTGYLSAVTKLNKSRLGRQNIFALGAPRPINGALPACDGIPAGLTLTSTAAGALGAPSFTGAFVGDACVSPRTEDSDDD